MAYQTWSVIFGEQPSAAKWNILGTNDASFNDGTGIADGAIKPEHLLDGSSTLNTWAWDTWTPTLSGRFTDGDWTKDCKYIQIGKTVFFYFSIIATDATPMAGGSANAIFTLPKTSATIPGTDTRQVLGTGFITDASATGTACQAHYGSTTTAIVYSLQVVAANVSITPITSASPQTWTTGDEISIEGFYEVP